MTTAPSRPRGRRPGHDDTRGAIREAAARLFEADGYDRVSLRAIARAADVDPALVHHYYHSKADLYSQAAFGPGWDAAAVVREIVGGSREQVGRRAARAFLDLWDASQEHHADYLDTLSRDTQRGRHAWTEMFAREVLAPVAASVGHANAALRGQLAAATLLGVMVCRHQLAMPVLTSLSLRGLVAPVGETLQHQLVDAW